MAVARDDTGLGHLRDVNPVALTDVKGWGRDHRPETVRNQGTFVFGIEPVFPKRVRPAYPAGREGSNGVRGCPAWFVAPN